MRTLDRYLAGIFLRNFIISLFALAGIFAFQALMGDLLDRTYPPNQLFYYHWLNLPQSIVQMAPPAVMLATVLCLAGISRTSELVAAYSIGIGLKRIVILLLSLVFMISCLVLVMEDRVLPPIYKLRTTYFWREMKHRPDFYLDIKQDKIWYRSNNMVYNLQRFDSKSRTIFGMSVYTFDDSFDLIQVVDADRAQFTATGWNLINGTVTVFSKEDGFPMTQRFAEKELLIAETPKDFQEIEKEVDGLRLRELHEYIQRIKAAGADTKSYEVKFHSRISLSFIPMIMCLLGVPFSVRTRRQGGVGKDFGICLGITFFYWLFYSIGLSLGTNGVLAPWLSAWLPSAVFGTMATVLIARLR